MAINKVLYNIDQRNDTTAAEKATARANIGAQGALTAGNNITISNDVISATNTEYQAGHGLTLSNNTFAVDDTVLQGKLTAGANIQLNGNTISATDTTYTAGSNVQISSGNVISATNTTYTAGSGISISNDTITNTAPNVKSDWNAAAGSDAEILNKPSIPTVNDGTLTIQRNGTDVATFSANQSANATANISVPTDTSDLTNGAGFITSAQVPAQVNADWNSTSGASEILNKPTIPTVNDGTLTIQVNGTQLATFSANQSGNTTANITGVGGTDVVTRTNGQGGYVETSVSKLTLDTDFNQIIGNNGTEIGVYAPPPYTPNTPKVLGVTAGSDIPQWVDPAQGVSLIGVNTSNNTTAQDAVWTAIQTALTAGQEPILYSAAGSGVLYWTLEGFSAATGYDFGRSSASRVQRLNINASHIVTTSTLPFVPGLQNMTRQNVSIDSNFGGTLTLYDNVAYVCTVTDGSSITLATDSALDIHCKIYLQNDTTWSSCPTVTVQWRDEARYVNNIDYTWYDYQHVRRYGLDVICKKVVVSESPYLAQSMFRVTEYPCASHVDLDDSETKYIGQQAYD